MNARQKAKMYKRRYESLLHKPIKFNVEQHKIDTLRFTSYYPKEFIINMDKNDLEKFLLNNVVKGLVFGLEQYISYHCDFIPSSNVYYLEGEIKVVSRK